MQYAGGGRQNGGWQSALSESRTKNKQKTEGAKKSVGKTFIWPTPVPGQEVSTFPGLPMVGQL